MKKMHIGTYGQVFVFEEHDHSISKLMANLLYESKFTGTCEYYSGDLMWGLQYGVGLLLRFESDNKTPDYLFWEILKGKVLKNLPKAAMFVHMEATNKLAMESSLILHGTFCLEAGLVKESMGDSFKHSDFYQAMIEKG